MIHEELTEIIIRSFYTVYNSLGFGFLEKVYQNAMAIELTKHGLSIETHSKIPVYFTGYIVGEYYADIIVDRTVVIELKAAECLMSANEKQLVNYLKASQIEVGLLLNFGKVPQIKRNLFENKSKPGLNQFQ